MDRKEELKARIEGVDASLEYFKQVKSELEAELAEQEKQEGNQEWKPERREKYWFIDLDIMEVKYNNWNNDVIGNIRLQYKIVFKTKAEASEYIEYLQAKEKAINEFSKEEWEDENINKHHIYYSYKLKKFYIGYEFDIIRIGIMCFRTEESAQEFIDKYEKMMRRELGI